MKKLVFRASALAILFCASDRAVAQVTFTAISSADTFLATGSPANPEGTNLNGLNFGAAGALVVAAAGSTAGEFQTVLHFDLLGATGLFNTNYGSNNWIITRMSLELTGNIGKAGEQPFNAIFPAISGGQFVIEWLSDNGWSEGTGTPNLPTTDGITYDSLPILHSGPHAILSTNAYVPPGDNVPVTYTLPLNTNLVYAAMDGSEITFLLYAADDQIAYLFNSYNFGRGNEPKIHVTAALAELLGGTLANGVFHLTGVGVAGQQYQVQASGDLEPASWNVIGTVVADAGGMIGFDDKTAMNHLQRFYRLAR